VTIYNGKAVLVHGRNTLQYGVGPPAGAPQGSRVRFRQDIRLALGPDDYTFEVGLATLEGDQLRHVCHLPAAGGFTVSLPAGVKEARHYGVADLSGECRVLVLPPAPRGKEPDPEDD
jgi:lipopolysaccharide transport system ATP-binding protein